MKGIVLAGGTGSRLYPLTKSLNKHMLPIFDRPMVYYPIESLVDAGINDIILVAGGNHMHQFIDLLGDGSELGCNIAYVCQMQAGGIAEAISLVEPFIADEEDIAVILGDNIFTHSLKPFVDKFNHKRSFTVENGRRMINELCQVVCKKMEGKDACNYGVLTDKGYGHVYITEKPKFAENYWYELFKVVTGFYIYTPDVFEKIKKLEPSKRGELEVSELNDMYAGNGNLKYDIIEGNWYDCGVNIDHMVEVSDEMKRIGNNEC